MRDFDPIYQVDGKALLVPDAGVALSWNDIDGDAAGRDAAGYLHRQVLRSGVRTWEFTYSHLRESELRYLNRLFAGKPTFTFSCEDGQITAYCAKREATLYDRSQGLYTGMKFSVIEC